MLRKAVALLPMLLLMLFALGSVNPGFNGGVGPGSIGFPSSEQTYTVAARAGVVVADNGDSARVTVSWADTVAVDIKAEWRYTSTCSWVDSVTWTTGRDYQTAFSVSGSFSFWTSAQQCWNTDTLTIRISKDPTGAPAAFVAALDTNLIVVPFGTMTLTEDDYLTAGIYLGGSGEWTYRVDAGVDADDGRGDYADHAKHDIYIWSWYQLAAADSFAGYVDSVRAYNPDIIIAGLTNQLHFFYDPGYVSYTWGNEFLDWEIDNLLPYAAPDTCGTERVSERDLYWANLLDTDVQDLFIDYVVAAWNHTTNRRPGVCYILDVLEPTNNMSNTDQDSNCTALYDDRAEREASIAAWITVINGIRTGTNGEMMIGGNSAYALRADSLSSLLDFLWIEDVPKSQYSATAGEDYWEMFNPELDSLYAHNGDSNIYFAANASMDTMPGRLRTDDYGPIIVMEHTDSGPDAYDLVPYWEDIVGLMWDNVYPIWTTGGTREFAYPGYTAAPLAPDGGAFASMTKLGAGVDAVSGAGTDTLSRKFGDAGWAYIYFPPTHRDTVPFEYIVTDGADTLREWMIDPPVLAVNDEMSTIDITVPMTQFASADSALVQMATNIGFSAGLDTVHSDSASAVFVATGAGFSGDRYYFRALSYRGRIGWRWADIDSTDYTAPAAVLDTFYLASADTTAAGDTLTVDVFAVWEDTVETRVLTSKLYGSWTDSTGKGWESFNDTLSSTVQVDTLTFRSETDSLIRFAWTHVDKEGTEHYLLSYQKNFGAWSAGDTIDDDSTGVTMSLPRGVYNARILAIGAGDTVTAWTFLDSITKLQCEAIFGRVHTRTAGDVISSTAIDTAYYYAHPPAVPLTITDLTASDWERYMAISITGTLFGAVEGNVDISDNTEATFDAGNKAAQSITSWAAESVSVDSLAIHASWTDQKQLTTRLITDTPETTFSDLRTFVIDPPDTISFTAMTFDTTSAADVKLDFALNADQPSLAWFRWKELYDGTYSPAIRWYSSDDHADTTKLQAITDTINTTISTVNLDSAWVMVTLKDLMPAASR